MRALTFCLLVLTITSCQRYIVVSTQTGVDVHLQGNHIELIDSVNNYQRYFVKGAYKNFIKNKDLNSLLAQAKEPKNIQPEINSNKSSYTEKRVENFMKPEVILNGSRSLH